MTALLITTEAAENTIDGLAYNFTRSDIDYTIMIEKDCVTVWKNNNQRGLRSVNCFWNGLDDKGRPMAKFLKQALQMIAA